jgi:hypothetical protein
MDAQLTEALAEILADALLADLEAEEEHAPIEATTKSPTGSGSQNATSPDGSAGVRDVATAA